MRRNALIGRLLTPAGFATALLLFLLPFLTFSCSGPGTPSEELPVSGDASISATFTGLDLIMDDDPTIQVEQGGVVITIDASDIPAETDEPVEEEGVPTKIRAPMIGAAGVLLLGALLALIPAHAVRRVLAIVAAVAAAGGLSYVIYFAAADYIDDAKADLATEGTPPGIDIGSGPAVGFWAIVGVLALVVILQVIPAERSESAAAGPTAPLPPAQYGGAYQPGATGSPYAGGQQAGPPSY